jgi:hypothetical protein
MSGDDETVPWPERPAVPARSKVLLLDHEQSTLVPATAPLLCIAEEGAWIAEDQWAALSCTDGSGEGAPRITPDR